MLDIEHQKILYAVGRNVQSVWRTIGKYLKKVEVFPGGSVVKNLPANAGVKPALGRSPGEGNGNPLQYSCLGNPMDRGALWAAVHGVTKESVMTEQPS